MGRTPSMFTSLLVFMALLLGFDYAVSRLVAPGLSGGVLTLGFFILAIYTALAYIHSKGVSRLMEELLPPDYRPREPLLALILRLPNDRRKPYMERYVDVKNRSFLLLTLIGGLVPLTLCMAWLVIPLFAAAIAAGAYSARLAALLEKEVSIELKKQY